MMNKRVTMKFDQPLQKVQVRKPYLTPELGHLIFKEQYVMHLP